MVYSINKNIIKRKNIIVHNMEDRNIHRFIYFYNFIKNRYLNSDKYLVIRKEKLSLIDLNDKNTVIFHVSSKADFDNVFLNKIYYSKCKKVLFYIHDYSRNIFIKNTNIDIFFDAVFIIQNNLDKIYKEKFKNCCVSGYGLVPLITKETLLKRIRFRDKENKIIFIGRITGRESNRLDLFRHLMVLSKKYPIDVEIICIPCKEYQEKDISGYGFKYSDKKKETQEYYDKINKCKYSLSPFGNSSGSWRFLEGMALGSISVSHNIDSFGMIGGFKDGENYISIGEKTNFNDVEKFMNFISNSNNEKKLEEIANKGRDVYDRFFTVDENTQAMNGKAPLVLIKRLNEKLDGFFDADLYKFEVGQSLIRR